MGVPIGLRFVVGRGGRERVLGKRGAAFSSWKWAWDCHKVMFDSWGRVFEVTVTSQIDSFRVSTLATVLA